MTVGGRTLLSYPVERAAATRGLRSLVVVAPQGYLDRHTWGLGALAEQVVVVAGGAQRSDSVRSGLAQIDPGCEVILIHDAARAFTPTLVFDRVVAAVRIGVPAVAGVVPGLPVADTIKRVDGSDIVTDTPKRATLRAVQTPQGFRADVLRAAYTSARVATDDAALVELLGHRVRVVEGDPLAFKVTTPEDLARAEQLVAGWRQ